jgi:hypothetical protein
MYQVHVFDVDAQDFIPAKVDGKLLDGATWLEAAGKAANAALFADPVRIVYITPRRKRSKR